MSFPSERRAEEAQSPGVAWEATSFTAYIDARERHFTRLRADSELTRLESAWRLPSAGRGRPSDHASKGESS